MGASSSEFFRLMSRGPPRGWAWQARQILLLRERYSTEEIERALGVDGHEDPEESDAISRAA